MRTEIDRKSSAQQAGYLKALSHPLRMQILHELNRGMASPKEIADRLGESIGMVSYHVRTLEELGCIELADTKFRRGAVQHFYRPLRRAELTDSDWNAMPKSIRESVSAATFDNLIALVGASLASGTFEQRTDRHLSYVELQLDEDGWREVNEGLLRLLDRALELQAEAATSGEEKIKSVLGLAHFER